MNRLSDEKQNQVLALLVEGSSVRSVERITGVHRDTIVRLLQSAGANCARLMDQKLIDLKCEEVEVDELWGYVAKKQKNVQPTDNSREVGDQWVFVAMDAQTKVVCSYFVGKRTLENATQFMRDIEYRMKNRISLNTDGWLPYNTAVENAFGGNVDYGQVVKVYTDTDGGGRYSPGKLLKVFPTAIKGSPKRVSTSFIERQNLTVRMQVRRFTRLTNAFSKKLASMKAAIALHFAHYNFMRVHKTLRVTPAMQAGLTDHVWTWQELLCQP